MLEIFSPPDLFSLPTVGTNPAHQHRFDDASRWAVRAALATGRPLLLRGEPGVGKTQFARATAGFLKRPLISQTVTARSESRDLLWTFDAVARLAKAHEPNHATVGEAAFIQPGPLWWLFDWNSAEKQRIECLETIRRPGPQENEPPGCVRENGAVLLLDEIDKAEADLPNGLLEALGSGRFEVPLLGRWVSLPPNTRPLIIITTNEERDLPAPFLRRCLVLQMYLPDTDPANAMRSDSERRDLLITWLVERGRSHHEQLDDKTMILAAGLVADARQSALDQGLNPPGQAEYLDLLQALVGLPPDAEHAKQPITVWHQLVLDRIGRFALKKHPVEIR